MSHERVLKTLVGLGVSQTDAEVYVFLASGSAQKAREIAVALKTYKRKIYRSLKSLKTLEIVSATPERPALFSALPFERVLDLLVKAHLEEVQYIELNREEILAQWESLVRKDNAG